MKTDHVDNILQQWAVERPDLDVSPMAVTGRIAQISAFFKTEMQKTFALYDLNHASFDLLATLLRSGPPYALPPGDLLASAMVTSGTMTNRIDRLQQAGLVDRKQCVIDKRSYWISLTDAGHELISEAITEHVATLHRIVASMPQQDLESLSRLLRQLVPTAES